MTIEQRVKSMIADYFSVDAEIVTEEKHLENDLWADSLDTIELVMLAEEKFNIEIDDAEAEKVTTVGEAIELVKKYIAK